MSQAPTSPTSSDSDVENLRRSPKLSRKSVIVSSLPPQTHDKKSLYNGQNPKPLSPVRDVAMCSESGSEKESSASRGDSDSSTSVNFDTQPKKRKTPEKSHKNRTESSSKVVIRDPETFLQDHSCSKYNKNSKISKCRECFKSVDTNLYNCRFFGFRKVRWSKANLIYNNGFASPRDASEEDLALWSPILRDNSSTAKKDPLDFHVARFILLQVGNQFCHLLDQEGEALKLHMGDNEDIAWKKPMKGLREICDVCKTTLFNFHWACARCGFVVCIDCYKTRKSGVKKAWMVKGQDHDEWKWLHCTTRQPHEQDVLMLCQIIAADCLEKLGQYAHAVKDLYGIPQTCNCDRNSVTSLDLKINKERLQQLVQSDPIDAIIRNLEGNPKIDNGSEEHEAKVLAEAKKQILPNDLSCALQSKGNEDSSSDSDDDEEEDNDHKEGKLRSFFERNTFVNDSSPIRNPVVSSECEEVISNQYPISKYPPASDNNTDIVASDMQDPPVIPIQKKRKEKTKISQTEVFDKVVSSVKAENDKVATPLEARHMTQAISEELYPGVPHSWLCEGALLRLVDPSHSGNYRIFQDQWKRGQPVIVGNMTKLLNMDLWHPDSFCRDFGDERNDLINCATGHLVPNRPMREFWEGFGNYSKRLKDEHGNPMLLKLKDWPPGEDFAELLPQRFHDLMAALPLSEYTRRTGRLNLASCLPDFFVRPDLGPKMYNAYGSALYPTKGTTNLHLDISDAVNFMVYVGIPSDSDYEKHIEEAYNAIDEAGCDDLTLRVVRTKGVMPGALWHIYHACDANKIRDLLNKVAIEKGERLEPHNDPIHDQCWYLDTELRNRLEKEYGVKGYAIVQCLGDAVFIPAGAPHQVRNLHNCVKVAEDFVSPENVSHCFHLTQEFRDLSDTHTNHEDKLQIKNIIFHTIKNAVSSLLGEIIEEGCTESQTVIKNDFSDIPLVP